MKTILEIACFEITSALIALQSLADRIEFCSERNEGGLTPNLEEFRYLRSLHNKPIFIMIRPKSGSFLYSDEEFEQMKKELLEFKAAGANGFVFGILEEGNRIDQKRNKTLLELASPLPCTFHRAFDRTPDLKESIELLIQLGFSAVLTSGGASFAVEGKEVLKELQQSYGSQIDILVGGGVRSSNISELQKEIKSQHYHSSAVPQYETFVSEEEIKSLRENLA